MYTMPIFPELKIMKVLHVEMGRHLYGGARQVAYLLNGLSRFPGRHVLACGDGAEIVGAVQNPAVEIRPLPFRGDADVVFIGRLRRLIRNENPNVLHIHSRRGDLLAALAGRLEKVPMIHSRRVDNPPRWVDTRVKFPLFETIVTISEGIRAVLIEAGVRPERVICVPSAVDTGRYRPVRDEGWFRLEFGLAQDETAFGMIAQMIARKGHDVLFDALPEVLAQHPKTRVLLFGQGPMEDELRTSVRDRGLQSAVTFAGYRNDMARVIPCLDLVVHPAWMEGLGVSLLEAAACAVPIVATRAGGMPEIVQDGINGRLIDPGDSAALASALVDLLNDTALRRQLGHAGRRLVLERFSVDAMVEGNYRVYRSVSGGANLGADSDA
ncbi:GDP-mannose-dependent alpha-(1-6)-phosphatidylinositol monomannoside mannosyltransferase [Methylocaldum marinum]|uniref:GDP-mannose-dependent alpha-(1-6)-phosphatidylinositol monomannoside mannosyltransferase n=1 Tax=Methylocaldum marinum TaxID=1432792 RepID=A0A250KU58_9GAMM|nr:glycosyltransferase family 4 protein [Methylocaldum marinum]BBA35198.1 GDP-mannose-dependent alpha-(1-6)-phosphatidylinositol monomannoside mannosyltransferase [Methylocaldum marinum]